MTESNDPQERSPLDYLFRVVALALRAAADASSVAGVIAVADRVESIARAVAVRAAVGADVRVIEDFGEGLR